MHSCVGESIVQLCDLQDIRLERTRTLAKALLAPINLEVLYLCCKSGWEL